MTEVSTTEYEFAHGSKPRGYGHWAFFFDDGSVFWVEGKYTDAKKAALVQAKQRKSSFVKVGS